MDLLKSFEFEGYPDDYLLSRIKGRRVYLITNWQQLLYSTKPFEELKSSFYKDFFEKDSQERIWEWFSMEFQWVYLQMNRKLRNIFSQFSLYFEIEKTLLPCLRYKLRIDEEGTVERLLSTSLLSYEITKAFKKGDLFSVLECLEDSFIYLTDSFAGLKEIYLKDGLMAVEQKFICTYLEYVVRSETHHILKNFFIALIDIRNTLTMLKHLKWNIYTPPAFVSGGNFEMKKLKKIVEKHEVSCASKYISRLTGTKTAENDPSVIEALLLKRLTTALKNTGREPSGVGLILDYLWRCYIQSLNLRTILYGSSIDKESIDKELIH